MSDEPVAPNLCWDPGCPQQGICVRSHRPSEPRLGRSLFPADAEIDDECPFLIDRRDGGR